MMCLITLLALLGWREFVLLGKAKRVRISIIWGYISILLLMIALSMSSVYYSYSYFSIKFICQLYVVYIW